MINYFKILFIQNDIVNRVCLWFIVISMCVLDYLNYLLYILYIVWLLNILFYIIIQRMNILIYCNYLYVNLL